MEIVRPSIKTASDLNKKKEFFRLDITSLQVLESKNIEIIFKKPNNKIGLPEGDYNFISKIKILGLDFKPIRIYIQTRKGGESIVQELSNSAIEFHKNLSVLEIKGINLPLTETSYKVVLQNN